MVRKSDVITFYYFYDQENTDNVKQKIVIGIVSQMQYIFGAPEMSFK